MNVLAYPPVKMPISHPPRQPIILPPRLDADCLANFLPIRNNTWVDRSGNGYHGTLAGATWSTKGRRGPGVSFAVANDRVTTDGDPLGAGAGSFEVWCYPTNFGVNGIYGVLFGNKRTICYVSTLSDLVTFTSTRVSTKNSGANSITLNKWHHVVITRTAAGILNFYINGAISGTPNQAGGAPIAGDNNMIIGWDTWTTYSFAGIIDELRVYNRVLSLAEIHMLYQMGRPH